MNETTIIEWNDGLGPRSRRAWLLLVKGEEIFSFEGESISGIVVVRGSDYQKNGKWSKNSYRLQLASGVQVISGRAGWETGLFAEGLGRATNNNTPDTWMDLANCLGVSVPAAMKFIRDWSPRTAEALDKTEAALMALEDSTEASDDTEMVVVSFGSPTNRAISEGYWEKPKDIPGFKAEIRLIDPKQGWIDGNIEVVGISGSVISAVHSRGMHGGYYGVTVAVIPGTESEIPAFQTAREKAAKESDLPEDLYHAFRGDEGKVREFIAKVEELDAGQLDSHEMSCGRDRKRFEVIRVSGDEDFFLGADPLDVCGYIDTHQADNIVSRVTTPEVVEPEQESGFLLADLAAKFRKK